MWRPCALAAFLMVLLGCAPAASARPAEGGRYVGDVTFGGDRCRRCVRLAVANDGGQLQRNSSVDLTRRWRRGVRCDVPFWFDAWDLDDRSRVFIAADGSFSRRIRYFPRLSVRIAGRFLSSGRGVRGTLTVRGRRPRCRIHATLHLRARLVGRPRAPVAGRWSRCDPYVVGRWPREARWDVFDRDIGCTTARTAAQAWLTLASCRDIAVGSTCTAGALQCAPVNRGERAPPDQVRCVRSDVIGPAVELLLTRHCGYEHGVDTYSRNVPCADAQAVVDSFEHDVDCLDDVCTINGYSCRLEDGTDTSFIYRCRSGDRALIEIHQYG